MIGPSKKTTNCAAKWRCENRVLKGFAPMKFSLRRQPKMPINISLRLRTCQRIRSVTATNKHGLPSKDRIGIAFPIVISFPSRNTLAFLVQLVNIKSTTQQQHCFYFFRGGGGGECTTEYCTLQDLFV